MYKSTHDQLKMYILYMHRIFWRFVQNSFFYCLNIHISDDIKQSFNFKHLFFLHSAPLLDSETDHLFAFQSVISSSGLRFIKSFRHCKEYRKSIDVKYIDLELIQMDT